MHKILCLPARLGAGLLLAGAVAGLSVLAAATPFFLRTGVSALTLAILAGIVLGNTVFPPLAARAGAGVDFARGGLLRLGVVLYQTAWQCSIHMARSAIGWR